MNDDHDREDDGSAALVPLTDAELRAMVLDHAELRALVVQ
jgi:hypothetical protein